MAKKNVRVKRESVEGLLNDLIKQAEYINSCSDKTVFPFTVKKLWVFGSYLNSEKSHLGDIDIFYHLECRWPIEEVAEMSNYYLERDQPHTPPGDGGILGRLEYPETITLKFLRNKHSSFSFMPFGNKKFFKKDPERKLITKLIYEYND
jgi:predicted nucleotidyltransferase